MTMPTGLAVIIGMIFGLTLASAMAVFMPLCAFNTATETTPVITPEPTIAPAPTIASKQYVACSEYHRVTEKWKTPTAKFVVIEDNKTIRLMDDYAYTDYRLETHVTPGDNYDAISVGEFVKPCEMTIDGQYTSYCSASLVGGKSLKLTPVTESESGYRDACEVIE